MFTEKEKFVGTWNGREVKVNRCWGGHRFSDFEVEELLNGGNVELLNMVSLKTGNTYDVSLKLAERTTVNSMGETITYIGCEPTFLPKVPDVFCNHKFTFQEKAALERGEQIYVEGFVSKKGNIFNANVTWVDDPARNSKKLNLTFF